MIFGLTWSKIGLIRQKMKGDLPLKKLRKHGGLFMRSISMEKELTLISVNFGRNVRA